MDNELIKKYFRGECTTEEAAEFLKWLKSKKSERELSEYLDEKWEELNYDFSDKPQLLQKIHKIIDEKEIVQSRRKNRMLSPVLKIAASLTLISTLLYAFYAINHLRNAGQLAEDAAENTIVKTTEVGQKLKITLPDGSAVLLNAASKIAYPVDFNDTLRSVEFAGEAFFEVKKDERRPFVVKTADVSTRVLGTAFNIRYRSEEEKIHVALLSGSVNVDVVKNANITLEPGDLAVFDRTEERFLKEKWDYKKDFGWKDGILYFNRATLTEVKEKLEMWYGVDIEIHDQVDLNRHFTGSFKNENLQNVLESLSFTFGFSYDQNDRYVSVQF